MPACMFTTKIKTESEVKPWGRWSCWRRARGEAGDWESRSISPPRSNDGTGLVANVIDRNVFGYDENLFNWHQIYTSQICLLNHPHQITKWWFYHNTLNCLNLKFCLSWLQQWFVLTESPSKNYQKWGVLLKNWGYSNIIKGEVKADSEQKCWGDQGWGFWWWWLRTTALSWWRRLTIDYCGECFDGGWHGGWWMELNWRTTALSWWLWHSLLSTSVTNLKLLFAIVWWWMFWRRLARWWVVDGALSWRQLLLQLVQPTNSKLSQPLPTRSMWRRYWCHSQTDSPPGPPLIC